MSYPFVDFRKCLVILSENLFVQFLVTIVLRASTMKIYPVRL